MGASTVEIWCIGAPKCHNWNVYAIERAIDLWGSDLCLVMLARRARCTQCGRKGCHVQVTSRQFNGSYRWEKFGPPGPVLLIDKLAAENDNVTT